MDENNIFRTEVDFVVEGECFSVDEITNKMGIFPDKIRTKEDWPDAIKNNPNLPEELKPRYIWGLNEIINNCRQIENPISKMIRRLMGKEQIIIDLCNENSLRMGLVITIHASQMDLPEIVLSSQTLSYLGNLGVEISFDIYTY